MARWSPLPSQYLAPRLYSSALSHHFNVKSIIILFKKKNHDGTLDERDNANSILHVRNRVREIKKMT